MRALEKTLSTRIRDIQFGFLPPATYTIDEIYNRVKAQFPDLCDDHYLCSQACNSGHNQPEWMHVVRGCIQSAKTKGLLVNTGRGSWQKVQRNDHPQ